MRQFVAITLLLIHLFNTGGYRIAFDAMAQNASDRLIARLDEDVYREDELIEMKVALPMPYQTNWAEFERYNGEIEINGIHYNYVKRKVWNDTLILKCIPNTGKMTLNSAKEQFFSLVNDLESKGKPVPMPEVPVIKSITSEYPAEEMNLHLAPPIEQSPEHFFAHSSIPSPIYLDGPIQPPCI